MTCIVAIKSNNQIIMGADSAGIAGYELRIRKDPKIYKVGEFLFGFTSSFRMGQILGYSFVPPEHRPDYSIEKYMHQVFVDALRDVFHSKGFSRNNSGEESGGTFLIAYRNHIFQICSDFQVAESIHDFDAVGCGADVALGALFATTTNHNIKERATIALNAAEQFSSGVRSPFIFETITYAT